ncbi:MAG TPA: sulfite exporter TauE/SafE family protein [Thermoanaerobaculia bacterium]|nr:sulfite exporter TauE/SafE family protein [Thermoanaerobaculia bacterium]
MRQLLVFGVSLIASLLSSLSGGGSSIIAIPVFLSMGISFPMATAMQKVNACFWVLPAARNYLKGREIDWRFAIAFAMIGLVGAYLGLLVVLSLNPRVLNAIVGVVVLLLVIYIQVRSEVGLSEQVVTSRAKRLASYLIALPMGFYESLLGAGNGIFFVAASFYTRGFDFITALGYYFMTAFVWVAFAAGVLIHKGYFSWSLMLPTVLGALAGGYCGSRLARLKGNRFVKLVFVLVGGALALKLILGV